MTDRQALRATLLVGVVRELNEAQEAERRAQMDCDAASKRWSDARQRLIDANYRYIETVGAMAEAEAAPAESAGVWIAAPTLSRSDPPRECEPCGGRVKCEDPGTLECDVRRKTFTNSQPAGDYQRAIGILPIPEGARAPEEIIREFRGG